MGIKDINSTLKDVIADVKEKMLDNKKKEYFTANIAPLQTAYQSFVTNYTQLQQANDPNLYTQMQELYNQISSYATNIQSHTNYMNTIVVDDIGFTTVPISFFTGKRVAVDISIVINAKMNIAHNDLLTKQRSVTESYSHDQLLLKSKKLILGFVSTFINNGITPVFVLDGKMHPAKLECVSARSEEKSRRQQNVNTLIDNFLAMNPLDRNQQAESNLASALRNTVSFSKTDRDEIINMLKQFGFPFLQAEYDGEVLCAALCREGIVDAVFGNDTDNYPLGTKILITEISHDKSQHVCKIAHLDQIKWALSIYFGRQVDDLSFIDLCILHGCDFNNYNRMQIPQKKDPTKTKSVGGKGALDLIKTYGYFEYFPPNYQYYFGPLNIATCREIFRYKPSCISENDANIDWDIFSANATNVLQSLNCEGYIIGNFSRADPRLLKINSQHFNIGAYNTVEQSIPQIGIQKQDNVSYGGYEM